MAANFRAFIRGRSEAEKYAKICIVVEEVDETQFWMELMEEADLLSKRILIDLYKKAEELTKVFTSVKHKMK